MLGMIGETWSMIMRRDREEELLFRGKQITDAIARFNNPDNKNPQGTVSVTALGDLRFLYEADPRFLERRRYLRKNYLDPITGKEWQLIKDPAKGIVGVVSSSEQEPLKKANFPTEPEYFKSFEGKTKYKDWQFVNRPLQQGGVPGRLPGGGAAGGAAAGGAAVGGAAAGGAAAGGQKGVFPSGGFR